MQRLHAGGQSSGSGRRGHGESEARSDPERESRQSWHRFLRLDDGAKPRM